MLDTRLIRLTKGKETQLEEQDLQWLAETSEELHALGYDEAGKHMRLGTVFQCVHGQHELVRSP